MVPPSIKIGRPEFRAATNDSGVVYFAGMGDNFFTTTLFFTDQVTGLNTLTQTDSSGKLTSTAWLIVSTDSSGGTNTFAATGTLRDYFIHPDTGGHIAIDIFVRITGDTISIT